MIGRAIDDASDAALRRLTRARDWEWEPGVRAGAVGRSFVGHLEGWEWDGLDAEPVERVFSIEQRRRISVRFFRLCARFGTDCVVDAIRARAKRRLGRQQVLTP